MADPVVLQTGNTEGSVRSLSDWAGGDGGHVTYGPQIALPFRHQTLPTTAKRRSAGWNEVAAQVRGDDAGRCVLPVV